MKIACIFISSCHIRIQSWKWRVSLKRKILCCSIFISHSSNYDGPDIFLGRIFWAVGHTVFIGHPYALLFMFRFTYQFITFQQFLLYHCGFHTTACQSKDILLYFWGNDRWLNRGMLNPLPFITIYIHLPKINIILQRSKVLEGRNFNVFTP